MAAMKRGAKRAALSDLAPEPIDTSVCLLVPYPLLSPLLALSRNPSFVLQFGPFRPDCCHGLRIEFGLFGVEWWVLGIRCLSLSFHLMNLCDFDLVMVINLVF